jgi:Kef-type K+ transport system membrane component KefB/nucleotide-binding universal stress UspA family protein
MALHRTRPGWTRGLRRFASGGACGGPFVLAASTAWAAEPATTSSGASEVVFLAQVVLLLLVGRLLGEAMQRLGQPAVIGQLLAGILLGPSVFGMIWPEAQHAIFPANGAQKSMIDGVSQLGILMLLLLTGMEIDLRLVRKVGAAAASVSLAGISLPFLCGFTLGEFLPDSMLPKPDQRVITSLFLGTALSISSIKIVAMVVREMNFMRRTVGQVIVASAIIDDSIGWIIIAITFGLAEHGTVDMATLARSVLGTALFLALSLTIGRRIVFSLIRWTNDNFVSEVPVITMILIIMGVMALTTHLIGVHTVLGAFVAGILVGESPILTRHISEQLRGLITALFAPVFFGLAGLGTDLSVLRDPSLVWLMLALIVIASAGKFGGAFVGGRLGGLTFRESLALGCGMNARGQTEVIIATIGLSLGMLSHSLFTLIVAMAVVTTTAMPPTLRWALGRLPLGEEERRRLEREEFEAKGFVSNMERLLIAVDESANGKFASRLAGLIAGSKGMPATVIRVQPADGAAAKQSGHVSGEHAIQAAAQAARGMEAEHESGARAKVSVITRAGDAPAEETVASEARKGYDLLVIGIENVARKAEFHEDVNRIAAQFEGALAIVVARGIHLERPLQSALNILVPVTGTEASRRAAEVGITIAQATGAPVTAMYVSTGRSKRAARSLRNALRSRRQHEAILRDVVEMAERYNVDLRTDVKVDVAADDAILRHTSANRNTLIVMGVNRRPGDALFFGNVAAAILEKSRRSILFVSSAGSIGSAQPAGKKAG